MKYFTLIISILFANASWACSPIPGAPREKTYELVYVGPCDSEECNKFDYVAEWGPFCPAYVSINGKATFKILLGTTCPTKETLLKVTQKVCVEEIAIIYGYKPNL